MKKNTKNTKTVSTKNTMEVKTMTKSTTNNTEKMTAEQVTDRIIFEALDNPERVERWVRAWTIGDYYRSRHGKDYSAYNKMLLAMQGAPEGEYLTHKQVLAEGGDIRKERNIDWYYVIGNFTKDRILKDKDGNALLDKDGNERHYTTYHAKYYKVCNAEDAGLKNKKKHTEQTTLTEDDLVNFADDVINAYVEREGIAFKNKSNSARAYYNIATDTVRIPRIQQYKVVSEYYSTAFHELTHSTGPRRKRDFGSGYGKVKYSKEELIAESGSALALARLGLSTENTFINTIAYIKGWLKTADKNDKTKRNTLCAAITSAESAVKLIFEGK